MPQMQRQHNTGAFFAGISAQPFFIFTILYMIILLIHQKAGL